MELQGANGYFYDRSKEVKEFDETKTGVKGLVDSGLAKIPRMFIHSPDDLQNFPSSDSRNLQLLQVPVIDLLGCDGGRRAEIVEEICGAAETWGFFQMVNHGIPVILLEELLGGVREFHEQAAEVKMEWYSRDHKIPVRYYCNGDLYVSKAANWRDSIVFNFQDGKLDPELMPIKCRRIVCAYMEGMMKLKKTLSELLSEAMGLTSDHFASMQCMETETLVCHYYPACPEPDLTIGATKHADPSFFTILLQDNIGGLQVLQQNQWLDVPFLQGGLIANIGDLMQLITNDKFRSVEHRVQVRQIGPRVSAACFFYPSKSRNYGPINEFISDDNPPKYRETCVGEYLGHYRSKGLDGKSALSRFEL